MEHTQGELEMVTSRKVKFKDVYFIRVKGLRDSFIFKVYAHTGHPARENALRLLQCWRNFKPLLDTCKRDATLADAAILATPTGKHRNKLTSINLLRMGAITAAEGCTTWWPEERKEKDE